jgi:hypothetical protein
VRSEPERLWSWYRAAFVPAEADNGFLDFGGLGLRIARRADGADTTTEPGPAVPNSHVEDARSVTAHLKRPRCLVARRAGGAPARPGTPSNRMGTTSQIIEFGAGHATTRPDRNAPCRIREPL